MYKIIKDYRNNTALRHSFNELALRTFGLNFEDWYQNGFWGDNYNPYSVVRDNKVIANISVSKTDMLFDGAVRHFLQLGTVMTDEACRNQGLSRAIMEQIDADYNGKSDGIYLFANDSVLDFYPKFGFEKSHEYQYAKKVSHTGACQFEKLRMNTPAAWRSLEAAMKRSIFSGRLDMVNNHELIMFYVTKFMQENVYYHKQSDTYVIADAEGENLFIHNIFSAALKELDTVTALFGRDIKRVTLGFVPTDTAAYEVTELHEEDCTLFIKGKGLDILQKEKLRIPSLSHA